MSQIITGLLETIPQNRPMQQLCIGINWTVAVVQNETGGWQVGLAHTPPTADLNRHSRFTYGDNDVTGRSAFALAQLALEDELITSAVGVATLNALIEPDTYRLKDLDAGDWLLEHGKDAKLAVFGRFPFIEEIKPLARNLWVFELEPQPGEFHPEKAGEILPQAEIIAITSSTLINHTLDGILKLVQPPAKVLLIGPSTPLSPLMFNFGVTMLSGVQVVDLDALIISTKQGVSFRQMQGTRRVSLI
jgi:hypothetical protein